MTRFARLLMVGALLGGAATAFAAYWFVLGARCEGRAGRYDQEPIAAAPPHSTQLGIERQAPRCGVWPVRGSAEWRYASTSTADAVLSWFMEHYGHEYNLQQLGGEAKPWIHLYGSRSDGSSVRATVIITAPNARVLPGVFAGKDYELPQGTDALVSIAIGDS